MLLVVAVCGCEDGGGSQGSEPPLRTGLLADPLVELPERLSDTGLFLSGDVEDVHPAVVRYEPGWPLWSNGSDKVRHLVLPEGTAVDETTDPWTFPRGTLFLKTFRYEVDGLVRPYETRALRLAADGWEYGSWLWDLDTEEPSVDDATRLDMVLPVLVSAPGPDGTPFEHEIPNRLQCRKCHESGDTEVLGYNALQLSSDASAPLHADPLTADVLGYFVGNCTHCHNGGFHASASFDLHPDVALANIVDHPTETSGTASGIRIVPGEPESSLLYLALSGEHDDPELKPMPPEGVQVRDAVAIERLREWIVALTP